jgi:tRNA (mo5U34)-methyltransferase
VVWFHSIELGDGTTTPGVKSAAVLTEELERFGLPADLTGQSVLDIGGWDGFFSFEAERRGAARVVLVDHYVWALDHQAQLEYWRSCQSQGVAPRPYDEVPGLFDPVGLPGRAGFDIARRSRQSHVEPLFGDFMEMDLAALGRFDLVLFLGVLYHLRDPFSALRRVYEVTAGKAVIETACAVFPGQEKRAMWQFLPSDELDGDPTNWWVPNAAGLESACRAAGFGHVDLTAQPGPNDPPNPGYDIHYGRAIAHAYRV